MTGKARTGGAVVAGAVLWAVLWNAGTLAAQAAWPDLMPRNQPIANTGVLLACIGFGSVLSVLAGYVTALIARTNAVRAVWILALLQLALGLMFEIAFWNSAPVWYHLVFLALIVPATVWGGKLRAG